MIPDSVIREHGMRELSLKMSLDNFPANVLEENGLIPRKSFSLKYRVVNVTRTGEVVFHEDLSGVLCGEVIGKELRVAVDEPKVEAYLISEFSFPQITENVDRIMWSHDLLDQTKSAGKRVPDVLSLFYKDGKVVKAQLTLNHTPRTWVNFCGNY